MDQALYGVEALQNYGYYDDALELSKKLFDNAEGLTADGPIRENYNPETGKGLHTKNFSWSASSYYLMYRNTLTRDVTTSQTSLGELNSEDKTIYSENNISTKILIGGVAILAIGGLFIYLNKKNK